MVVSNSNLMVFRKGTRTSNFSSHKILPVFNDSCLLSPLVGKKKELTLVQHGEMRWRLGIGVFWIVVGKDMKLSTEGFLDI